MNDPYPAHNAAMSDEQIDAAIASDLDEAGLGDGWMERGVIRSRGKEVVKKRKVA